jgi:hypothetical protein
VDNKEEVKGEEKDHNKLSRQSSNELNDFECKLFGDGVSLGNTSPPFLGASLLEKQDSSSLPQRQRRGNMDI